MTRDDFIRLVGPTLHHVTLATNLDGIRARGLLRPAEAARRAKFPSADLALRREAETIVAPQGPMTLNHQRPLLAGQAQDFLTEGTLYDWALQLDERIFFWPTIPKGAFAASLGDRGTAVVLDIDAGGLFDACAKHLDLAPINTGAATRRPAVRGPWIYVPASADVAAFRGNRVDRGLVTSSDRVVEVSARCDLPPAVLERVMTVRDG